MNLSATAVILLAAGQSSRMGSPKQLLPFQNSTLIEVVTDRLLSLSPVPLLVVLGANQEQIAPLLENRPVFTLFNPHWESGMASSIRTGITHIQDNFPQTDRVMVCLVDQPLILPKHYQQLLATSIQFPGKVIAAKYRGQPGVPMLFPKPFYSVLEHVQKDTGAKHWIRSHPESVVTVELPEAAFDWDTREDILRNL